MLSRRDFLFLSLGVGGGALGARWIAGHGSLLPRPASAGNSPRAAQDSAYGAMTAPPDELGPLALDDLTTPPQRLPGAP